LKASSYANATPTLNNLHPFLMNKYTKRNMPPLRINYSEYPMPTEFSTITSTTMPTTIISISAVDIENNNNTTTVQSTKRKTSRHAELHPSTAPTTTTTVPSSIVIPDLVIGTSEIPWVDIVKEFTCVTSAEDTNTTTTGVFHPLNTTASSVAFQPLNTLSNASLSTTTTTAQQHQQQQKTSTSQVLSLNDNLKLSNNNNNKILLKNNNSSGSTSIDECEKKFQKNFDETIILNNEININNDGHKMDVVVDNTNNNVNNNFIISNNGVDNNINNNNNVDGNLNINYSVFDVPAPAFKEIDYENLFYVRLLKKFLFCIFLHAFFDLLIACDLIY
jgi:hypothetical protein